MNNTWPVNEEAYKSHTPAAQLYCTILVVMKRKCSNRKKKKIDCYSRISAKTHHRVFATSAELPQELPASMLVPSKPLMKRPSKLSIAK